MDQSKIFLDKVKKLKEKCFEILTMKSLIRMTNYTNMCNRLWKKKNFKKFVNCDSCFFDNYNEQLNIDKNDHTIVHKNKETALSKWEKDKSAKHIPTYYVYLLIKFIYCEKTTKFCEISTLLLSVCPVDKSKVEISQNFVAVQEYTNFIY